MAKNTPAFQFYPSDYLNGTALLTPAARGVYMDLLCYLWIHSNLLPFCYKRLASITRVSATEFESYWEQFGDKFEIVDGNVTHPRFAKMIEISKKRRDSGSKGGFAKSFASDNVPSKTPSKTLANSRRMKNEDRRMKNEDRSMNNEVISTAQDKEIEEFKTAWNSIQPLDDGRETKKIERLTKSRIEKLKVRLRDPEWDWREGIKKLPIPYNPSNPEFTWQPDFEWFVKNEDNLFKLLEGKYERPPGDDISPAMRAHNRRAAKYEAAERQQQQQPQQQRLNHQGG